VRRGLCACELGSKGRVEHRGHTTSPHREWQKQSSRTQEQIIKRMRNMNERWSRGVTEKDMRRTVSCGARCEAQSSS